MLLQSFFGMRNIVPVFTPDNAGRWGAEQAEQTGTDKCGGNWRMTKQPPCQTSADGQGGGWVLRSLSFHILDHALPGRPRARVDLIDEHALSALSKVIVGGR